MIMWTFAMYAPVTHCGGPVCIGPASLDDAGSHRVSSGKEAIGIPSVDEMLIARVSGHVRTDVCRWGRVVEATLNAAGGVTGAPVVSYRKPRRCSAGVSVWSS